MSEACLLPSCQAAPQCACEPSGLIPCCSRRCTLLLCACSLAEKLMDEAAQLLAVENTEEWGVRH